MLDTYNPKLIESKWYQFWEANHLFDSNQNDNKNHYCIMLPPPNVTGSLHMGHAFQHTIMDTLCRHQRMLGHKVLWQPGTDHAGIATQIVVEKQLEAQGIKKKDLSREKFVQKVWQWKAESGGTITSQMRRLGSSVDWSCEKFTLDDKMTQSVIKAFVDLYDQGLIYQGVRLINWDPQLKTAISDLEVEFKEEKGKMYYVRYPMIDEQTHQPSKEKFITIATTRPETILADGAIAINPDNEKMLPLVGKLVRVPMTTRNIPIIIDDYVDTSFGTGCVKITPAHDYNDYKVGKRHKMEVINLFNDDASMNHNAPKTYQGLDRFVARKKIIQDLEREGLLEKVVDHHYKRPYSERTGVVVEPYLSKQWFLKTKDLAEKAKQVVADKQIEFIPENWLKTYNHWLNNIEDWCISRQLWWGHRIPCWQDEWGNHFVANNENEANKKAEQFHGKKTALTQDEDVLDTWFSSALWPFSTLGWPENTQKLKDFYPTSVLVTGFDIIFFWVARMIMFGCHFTGQIPFKQVYITGLIRDHDGQKMSKSKGNVIDPLDIIDSISLEDLLKKRTSSLMKPKIAQRIIEKTKKDFSNGIEAHGADALRFSFLTQASFGRNIRFDTSKIAGYRNFCNKIFNAGKYTLNLANNYGEMLLRQPQTEPHLFDCWIVSRLQYSEKMIETHLLNYRLDLAAETIYQFIWHEFCDWYLELGKTIINNKNTSVESKAFTAKTTLLVFEASLRLLHPMMPFLTEEIWQVLKQHLNHKTDRFKPLSISLCSYPICQDEKINQGVELEMNYFQKLVLAIRQIRSDRKIGFKIPLKVQLQNANDQQKSSIKKLNEPLQLLLNLSDLEWLDDAVSKSNELAANTVVDGMKVSVILTGAVDLEKEKTHLNQKIQKVNQEIEFLKKKLANQNFCEKAPQKLVEMHQQRLKLARVNLTKLDEQLSELG